MKQVIFILLLVGLAYLGSVQVTVESYGTPIATVQKAGDLHAAEIG